MLPAGGGRAVHQPAHCRHVVAVPALVADVIQPVLVVELVGIPAHAVGVQRDRRMVYAGKHPLPDALPARRFFAQIRSVPRQEVSHRVCIPAGNHVARQQNGLVFRQHKTRIGRVNLWLRTPFRRPQERDDVEQAGAHEGFQFLIEPLEESRIDFDSLVAAVRLLAFDVPVRRSQPLRRYPLHCRELLAHPLSDVVLPFLVR